MSFKVAVVSIGTPLSVFSRWRLLEYSVGVQQEVKMRYGS